jgi:hypothetical protein
LDIASPRKKGGHSEKYLIHFRASVKMAQLSCCSYYSAFGKCVKIENSN